MQASEIDVYLWRDTQALKKRLEQGCRVCGSLVHRNYVCWNPGTEFRNHSTSDVLLEADQIHLCRDCALETLLEVATSYGFYYDDSFADYIEYFLDRKRYQYTRELEEDRALEQLDEELDRLGARWQLALNAMGYEAHHHFWQREKVKLEGKIQRLEAELNRQKELRRKRDSRWKERQREKKAAADPWIKLAKLDILAEEGSTEAERDNAKQKASELRGRLMANAA